MDRYVYFMGGLLAGMGLIFYHVDTPVKDDCEAYKVRAKPVTAYILKPPYQAPEIIHEKCPVLKNPEIINQSEPVVNETVEEKPRHRRRLRRHRRYW